VPETDQLNLRLPKKMLKRLDQLVEGGHFRNRQELIREAVRRLVSEIEKESYTGP
jgi:Arc/MetJ-type ribon-helix-helix transcriptional regulator